MAAQIQRSAADFAPTVPNPNPPLPSTGARPRACNPTRRYGAGRGIREGPPLGSGAGANRGALPHCRRFALEGRGGRDGRSEVATHASPPPHAQSSTSCPTFPSTRPSPKGLRHLTDHRRRTLYDTVGEMPDLPMVSLYDAPTRPRVRTRVFSGGGAARKINVHPDHTR
ncbi:hypothetical protein HU200_042846 [Digitaria exilis]|uniref:Uncharacterized protein n=1 Tax=Digitaria exilis TaxID=1010633 RepID=A0A835B3N8_9POAL|nr:hypothetical protein HU200_042846 [Digitaria exilis]